MKKSPLTVSAAFIKKFKVQPTGQPFGPSSTRRATLRAEVQSLDMKQGVIAPLSDLARFERRYRLVEGLELGVSQFEGQSVGLIYCRYPLYVTRTSPPIVALLQKCDGQRSVSQIAHELGKKPGALWFALEGLYQKGLLHLEESSAVGGGCALDFSPDRSNYPAVSFIVPVRNRPGLLGRCLQSIFEQDYPPDKREVIVVDDASSDETAEVAASFSVILLRNTEQLGAGRSRNRAVAAANHDLLALIDSDCVVEPGWLRQMVRFFDEPEQVAVGGAIRAANTGLIIGRYEDVKSSLFTGERAAEVKMQGEPDQLPAANLLVRRSAFEQIGGHDPGLVFGEDVDLCWRLLKTGGRVSYRPIVGVKHAYRLTVRGFLKTRFNYATGEAHLQTRHAEKRRTLVLPSWSVLLGWLGLVGWLTKPRQGWLLLATVGPLLWRVRQKWHELKPYQLPLGPLDVARAETRSFLAAGYHLGQHLGRYYSLPLVTLALVKPKRYLLPVSITLLGPAWGDYVRRKPRLSFPIFAGLFLLENLFYQFGLIEGCRQARNWKALVPKVKQQSSVNSGQSSVKN